MKFPVSEPSAIPSLDIDYRVDAHNNIAVRLTFAKALDVSKMNLGMHALMNP